MSTAQTSRNSLLVFILCLLGIGVLFFVERLFNTHLFNVILGLTIVFYILGFPLARVYTVMLGYAGTVLMIGLYILSLKNPVNHIHAFASYLLSILILWAAIYWTRLYARQHVKNLKQREFLRAIFANTTEGIVICQCDGSIALANDSFGKMFGYDETELKKTNLSRLVPLHLQWLKNGGNSKNFCKSSHEEDDKEFVALNKEGYEFPVSISLRHFYASDRPYILAFVVDVTEKRRTEQELIREQQLNKKYLELAPILFLALDRYGTVKSINEFGAQMLGYPKTEVVGKNWFESFIPDHCRQEIKQYFNQIVKGPVYELNYENRILCYMDKECEISWRNSVLNEANNHDLTVLAAGIDVTERRKQQKLLEMNHEYSKRLNDHLEKRVKRRTVELEEALKKHTVLNSQLQKEVEGRRKAQLELIKSQRLYKLIAHHFPEGVIGVMDKNLRYIFADGEELSNIGLAKGRNAGERIFNNINAIASNEAESSLRDVFKGKHVSYDIRLNSKIYNITSAPLSSTKDSIEEALVVIKNITKQKKLEYNLVKTIEKEKELNAMKSRFVTMASHEFRTPLSVILSSSFLLENYTGETLEQKKAIYLNKIRRAVNSLTELMNDFVSLGKLEEGKINVQYSTINIVNFIHELIHEIELTKKNNQEIEYHHLTEEKTVSSDTQLLKGILANLLGNAIKYSPEGARIILNTIISEKGLKLSVKDTGIGIPQEEQSQIFKRFYRAQNTLGIEGTGIGLNIVRKYVRLLKGTIEFESNPGEGTTFTVTLPG